MQRKREQTGRTFGTSIPTDNIRSVQKVQPYIVHIQILHRNRVVQFYWSQTVLLTNQSTKSYDDSLHNRYTNSLLTINLFDLFESMQQISLFMMPLNWNNLWDYATIIILFLYSNFSLSLSSLLLFLHAQINNVHPHPHPIYILGATLFMLAIKSCIGNIYTLSVFVLLLYI